jgi:C4-dicarboxylate transporter DctM subunit
MEPAVTVLGLVTLLFGVFLLLLFLNVPIYVCLGVSSLVTLLAAQMPLTMVPIILFSTTSRFTLLAIPFFILAGLVMERAGISGRLVALIVALIGHVRGGLAMVTVVSCCLFGAISGSGPATVAAIGLILIPAMTKAGYDRTFSTALAASSAEVAILIPPSIALVVYGVISETSVGELFMAGMIPGILISLSLLIMVYWTSVKRGYGERGQPRKGLKEVARALLEAFWGLLAPVIILGGIYGGVFTPTEAAAVAAVYGIGVGVLIYRSLSFGSLFRLLVDTAVASGTIMVIVMSASVFAWMLTTGRVAQSVFSAMTSVTTNPVFVLMVLNVALLVAGCFMDAISAYYIFIPLFLPLAKELGIDPVHLGIIMTSNLAIGLITPPVGVDLYTACAISGVPFKDLCREVWPFVAASIIPLLLITYVPAISLWLPMALGMR